MFDLPSPKKASVRPFSSPLCSRMVRRRRCRPHRGADRGIGHALHRSARGRRGCRCHRHRHVGVDGQGGGEGQAPARPRPVQGDDRDDGAGGCRCRLHPLPAGRPRLRGGRRGHRRTAERRVGRGRARSTPGIRPAMRPGPLRRMPVSRCARSLTVRAASLLTQQPDEQRLLRVQPVLLLTIAPFDPADPATWIDVANGRSSILFATLAGVCAGAAAR
jgi:hypothetical protein